MNKSYKSVLLIAILLAITPIQSQLVEDENIPAILAENPVDSHLLKMVAALSEHAHFSKKLISIKGDNSLVIFFLEK